MIVTFFNLWLRYWWVVVLAIPFYELRWWWFRIMLKEVYHDRPSLLIPIFFIGGWWHWFERQFRAMRE